MKLKLTFLFLIVILVLFIICFYFSDKTKLSKEKEYIKEEEKLNELDNEIKKNEKLVNLFFKDQLKFNLVEPTDDIYQNKTFYKPEIYPELNNIDYNKVKLELEKYIKDNDDWKDWPEYELWKNKNETFEWKVIPLMCFGKWSDKYTKLFPETVSEIKNIPELVSVGFSKFGPKTRLELHKGWANLSNNCLRCHLGLKIPEDKCNIYVVGKTYDKMIQKEGKWIIFDDSLYHSADNNSNEERIILILDIKRPNNIYKGTSDVQESTELINFVKEFNKE